MIDLNVGKIRKDKIEEFLAALKEHGLFQLTEEGHRYFFDEEEGTNGKAQEE